MLSKAGSQSRGLEMGAQSDPFGEEMSLSPSTPASLGYRSAQVAAVALSGQKSCALMTSSF